MDHWNPKHAIIAIVLGIAVILLWWLKFARMWD
jgi:hypothetical protein